MQKQLSEKAINLVCTQGRMHCPGASLARTDLVLGSMALGCCPLLSASCFLEALCSPPPFLLQRVSFICLFLLASLSVFLVNCPLVVCTVTPGPQGPVPILLKVILLLPVNIRRAVPLDVSIHWLEQCCCG